MKHKSFLFSIIILLVASCTPTPQKAEKATINLLESNGKEVVSCHLIKKSNYEYEGFITYKFSIEELNSITETNPLLSVCFTDQIKERFKDSEIECKVKVLYDGRTVAITESTITEACEAQMNALYMNGLLESLDL